MDILRFFTAGSVDDGKSTLIGRLLYDSRSVSLDILEAIESSSKKNGSDKLDLSLLTDGLRAEREQGITIDVAYKYFTTPKRKFIIADTPGHIQYTRNMVTGASNANLAIILIDARQGVVEQTYRHSIIASLLGVPHLVVCINKMDLINYSEIEYKKIVETYKIFSSKLNSKEVTFIPISALFGDNIVEKSKNTPWYKGKSVLEHLEEVHVESDNNFSQPRFPVQYIIRPNSDEYHDYRGYAGKVISGIYKKGDTVTVLPSGINSKIKAIETFGKEVEEAFPPMSVILHLEDDVDISRSDTIVKQDNLPVVSQDVEATICWMNEKPMTKGSKLLLQHNSKVVKAVVKDILYKIDVSTLNKGEGDTALKLNDIAKIVLKTASPLAFDDYYANRANGSIILIDENTNNTVAAGMIASEQSKN